MKFALKDEVEVAAENAVEASRAPLSDAVADERGRLFAVAADDGGLRGVEAGGVGVEDARGLSAQRVGRVSGRLVRLRGDAVYATHGIFVGVMNAQGQSDLESANSAFIQQQINVNPDFRVQRKPERIDFGGRTGYATVVAGPSPVTSVTEIDVIYTTATADGRLFYLITMAPEDEFKNYQPTFQHILGSVQMSR